MRSALLTLVVLLGCRDKKPEPPPPPPPPPHDGVTLVQPGAEPLQVLRYRLTKGTRTASELACDFDVKNDDQGGPLPTLVVDLETAVEDVLADGTAKLRVTVVDTSVHDRAGSEAAGELVRAEAAAMQGVVITETLAPDGTISDARVDLGTAPADKPRTQLDNLLRSLEHVAMRLPAEPVGTGAMWRERKTLPEGGIRAISEITYTLVSLTGSTVAYTSIGASAGAPQTIEQDGMKVEVTNTRAHSETKGTLDLSRYALEVTTTSSFATAMNVVAPKGTPGAGPSTVEIAMAIHVSPAVARSADPIAPEPAAPATPTAPVPPATATPAKRSVAASPTTRSTSAATARRSAAKPSAAKPSAAKPPAARPIDADSSAGAPSSGEDGPAVDVVEPPAAAMPPPPPDTGSAQDRHKTP